LNGFAPEYSSVVIRSGFYLLTKGIVIDKTIAFIGEGYPTLKIQPNTSMDAISIWASDVVVANIRIDGSGGESTTGVQNGIAVGDIDKSVRGVRVINNIIENIRYSGGMYKGVTASYGFGVALIRGWHNIVAFNRFRNVMHWDILVHPINWDVNKEWSRFNTIIGNVGFDGLEGITILTHDNTAVGNTFTNYGRYGVILEGGRRNTIVGNVLFLCGASGSHDGKGGNGIRIMSDDNVVANNVVAFSYESGIAITNNARRNLVEGNFVANSNYKGDTMRRWGNIEVLDGASDNIIRGNKVYVGYYGYPRLNYGIRVLSTVGSGNIIEDNDVRDGGYYGNMLVEAPGQIVRRNIGYTTENSGVATITAGSTRVTVSHGLARAPSKVLITPLAQPPGRLWVENITSTSFDIVSDVAPATDLRVAWYAEV
jgi:parallel beta-helix repeat protein